MDSGTDSRQKPLVTVIIRGKVDGKFGVWNDRASDLYIEHHFSIGTVGIASRLVPSPIDCNGDDTGKRRPNLMEVRSEITGSETATKLDDGDGLSRAIHGHSLA